MDADRWTRVQDIFAEALERDPAQRPAFLDGACGDDDELRREVESLLTASAEADDYFDDLAERAGITQELGADPLPDPPATDLEGRRVGAYRLGALLGRGGMGAVYLAERDDGQFELTAALKLLAVGAASDEAHRRFLAERRILARLEHPAIARLFDGGVTDDGTPWFVMELVDGVPITRYVEERNLDTAERLNLFLDVCDAVAYAHQKLVVHRDLKPSNILVTDAGQVKLLDFGVARMMRGEGDTDPATEGGRMMTPRYASPEQLRGEPVTTSTDVYALGVILHELLTGLSPYGDHGERSSLMEAILEGPITAPSNRVQRNAGGTPAAGALARRLRGDLDTIVLMALRKEPERRYGSVEALAEDVRRHQDGYPVRARPDSVRYVAGRFLHRNAPAVAAVVAVIVLLTAVLIQSVRFAVTTREQAELIAHERDKAEEIAHFMRELFEVANPVLTDGESVTARELLDRGAVKIRTDHPDEPEMQAEMMMVLGTVYQHLGLPRPAMELLQEARRIQQEHPDAVSPGARAETLHELGLALRDAGEPQAAVAVLTEARQELAAVYGPDDRSVALTTLGLGRSLHNAGDLAAAEREFRGGVDAMRRLGSPPDGEYAAALILLAGYQRADGTSGQVEELYTEALRVVEGLHGRIHPDVPPVLRGLAAARNAQADPDSALSLLRLAVDIDQRLYAETEGGPHPELADSYLTLAAQATLVGRVDEAEGLVTRALRIYDTDPAGHPEGRAAAWVQLGRVERERGRDEPALRHFDRAATVLRESYGPGSLLEAGVAVDRADLLIAMGRHADAVLALEAALATYRDAVPDDHPEYRRAGDLLLMAQSVLH